MPNPTLRGRPAFRRRAALVAAVTALVALTTVSCTSQDCCARKPPHYGQADPHGPGTDADFPSQSLSVRPAVGMKFSVFVRLDAQSTARWSVASYGNGGRSGGRDRSGILRYDKSRTVPGSHAHEAQGTRTQYFLFHAEKTGTVPLVLKDRRSGRTMTYSVEVVPKGAQESSPVLEGEPRPVTSSADVQGQRAAEDFKGTVEVQLGKKFSVANSYSNVPGISWRIVGNSHPEVARLLEEEPQVTGDSADHRQDWYAFGAARKGTTTLTLAGCYRCASGSAAKSPESKRFSETKTISITVR